MFEAPYPAPSLRRHPRLRAAQGSPPQAGRTIEAVGAPAPPPGALGLSTSAPTGGEPQAASNFFRRSTSRITIGVKISCIANSIFPPGTTSVLARDMKESCSMLSR